MNANFYYRYVAKFDHGYWPKGGRVFSPTLRRLYAKRQRSHTFTSGGRVFILIWDGAIE